MKQPEKKFFFLKGEVIVTVRLLRKPRNFGSKCLAEGVICLLAGCGSTFCVYTGNAYYVRAIMAAMQVCI